MKKPQRLGDVCKLLDLQPYVLRYWETEFPMLRPEEGGGPNRVYGEAEITLLRRIKTLLYEEGYTIAGAKKKLESEPAGGATVAHAAPLFADEAPEPDADAAGDEGELAAAGEAMDDPEPAIEPVAERALLDTPNDERIETLRRGVAKALEEARAILALLEPRK